MAYKRVVAKKILTLPIIHDIFEDGTEFDSVVDIRLLLLAQANAFGVASTLNVEYTGVGPDVLVVSDE